MVRRAQRRARRRLRHRSLRPLILASTLSALHGDFAFVVVIANGLAAVWALLAARHERMRIVALWWFTGFAQVTILVEVVLGVALQQAEDIEPTGLHTFYGFLGLIAVAIVFAYRTQMQHRLYLLYGLGGLFIMGLMIRTMIL